MKILMAASEAAPFAKTGGLADVLGALPPALAAQGENVAVVLPAYGSNTYPSPPRIVYRGIWIPVGKGYLVDISEATERGVRFYFVDCAPLFERDGLYGSGGQDFPDNATRFAVFSRAVLEVARRLFRPDIIHCHDWQTALVPVYIRHSFAGDPTFYASRILFTIHNLGYQGIFDPDVLGDIALDKSVFTPECMEFWGQLNFMKGGIYFSDGVSTVSKAYADEIQTREFGFGLEGFLKEHAAHLTGILNGVDYEEWSPETDPNIPHRYSARDLAGKRECKRALLQEFGLGAENMDHLLIGIVSRFAHPQKGFDLVAQAGPELAAMDVAMTALGSGEAAIEAAMLQMAAAHPDRFVVRIGYDNGLAHRIEAGADAFLMPSRYEPCGLNQIYSLRYGTLPIVHATGGLDDTIDSDTGFKFRDFTVKALLGAVREAVAAYGEPERWRKMMRTGMERDNSWTASAREYVHLYRDLCRAAPEAARRAGQP